mgnify:CR=1 FL=1
MQRLRTAMGREEVQKCWNPVNNRKMNSTFHTVGIVGAGAMGRGIAQIAAQAGTTVKLFDVQPEMVEMLAALARRPEFANVVPVLGGESDVRLPADSLDLSILVDVYHELEYPYELLESLVRATRRGGRLSCVKLSVAS